MIYSLSNLYLDKLGFYIDDLNFVLFLVTPEVLYKLIPLYTHWEIYFDEQCNLFDLIVQVLINADTGINHFLNLIFDLIACDNPKFISLRTGTQVLFGMFINQQILFSLNAVK